MTRHRITIGNCVANLPEFPQLVSYPGVTPHQLLIGKTQNLLTAVQKALNDDPFCNNCRGIRIPLKDFSVRAATLLVDQLGKTPYIGYVAVPSNTDDAEGISLWIRPDPQHIEEWLWHQIWQELDNWVEDDGGRTLLIPIGGFDNSTVEHVIDRLKALNWEVWSDAMSPSGWDRLLQEAPEARHLNIRISGDKGGSGDGKSGDGMARAGPAA